MSFTEIVDDIQTLPSDDKIELKNLLEKYIIEERIKKFWKIRVCVIVFAGKHLILYGLIF